MSRLGLPLAQLDESFFRDRSDSDCIADNGAFCVQWVIDNFGDRYVTPLLEHLVLVFVSVALGFLIAFGMSLLSQQDFPRAREAIQGTGTQAISGVIPRSRPLY